MCSLRIVSYRVYITVTPHERHGLSIESQITFVQQFVQYNKKLRIAGPLWMESFLYARLKNGTYYAVAMSVRLSVRPSVRPRFPDFSSTCFEISIWNLVYTFSRWHDMSSLSFITIGSLWPSLLPKVGQTHFCNHGLINQDKFFKFGT